MSAGTTEVPPAAVTEVREGELQEARGDPLALPPGWEVFTDPSTGQPYYVDHNTSSTTWEHPGQAPLSLTSPSP